MARTVQPLGFTELHSPGDPELDIVFVHGLQGHPRKTWTYSDGKSGRLGVKDGPKKPRRGLKGILNIRSRKATTPSDSDNIASASAPIATASEPTDAGAGHTRSGVFWPEDLLPHLEECKQARILTYGYDSRLFDLVKKVNFSEITSQGETLLNGLARIRADCNHRPLMFVAHSLGGLLIKIALNESRKKSTNATAKDKYDIVNSTFAIVFFGTPHRGADIADLGLNIIRVAAAVTQMSYNPNIIKTLDNNNEFLKGLRKDFIDTVDYMISQHQFESSTFQESQGLSNVPGFRGKVVEDDSSELERNDRNDHIEADHMGMCRFSGSNDPGYAMVAGEITRHIIRQRGQAGVEAKGLMSSLEGLGNFANLRMAAVKKRTEGTLEWLFTAGATSIQSHRSDSPAGTPFTLGTWLAQGSQGNGLFWITGLPGSGKSTSMRHVFESQKTLSILKTSSAPQLGTQSEPSKEDYFSSVADYNESTWKRIGLFVTNFEGGPEQRKWETMLHGFLLQLLRSRPDLIHPMKQFVRDVEKEQRHLSPGIAKAHCEPAWTDLKWSNELVQRALVYCIDRAGRPLRVLVIVDGLDELEDDNSAREAARFLKHLAEHSGTSSAFRICVASRPEQHLSSIFVDVPRIEIHHHTKEDIRQHAWSLLRQNDQFSRQPEEDVKSSLKKLLDYIANNAAGVFLWAHAIASLANDELNSYKSVEDLHYKMEKLPTTMGDLYHRLLAQVNPALRLKAYITLEVVLRLVKPTLETVFHAVQETELWLEERTTTRQIPRKPFRKSVSSADLRRFRGQLVVSCRCMIRFQEMAPKNGRADEQVSLVHASAREFLLRPDFLDVLVPQARPLGNGHAYHLLYLRSWLGSLTPNDSHMDGVERVFGVALEMEATMTPEALGVFFEVLDDMEHTASVFFGESWLHQLAQVYIKKSHGYSPSTSYPSLLAWAVASGMYNYVVHRLSRHGACRKQVINNHPSGDRTHPLLIFTAGSGTPLPFYEMGHIPQQPWDSKRDPNMETLKANIFEYLVEQGANINALFCGKPVLFYTGVGGWQPNLRMIRFLLKNGASPDTLVCYLPGNSAEKVPLLHLVLVNWEWEHLQSRLRVAEELQKGGADFNKPDGDGVVLAEKLYFARGRFPSGAWLWVLEKGAKITDHMVAMTDSICEDIWSWEWRPGNWSVGPWTDEVSAPWQERAGICDDLGPKMFRHEAWDILRQPEFRRREWYTGEAAALAEKMKPGWFPVEENEEADNSGDQQTGTSWWNIGRAWRW